MVVALANLVVDSVPWIESWRNGNPRQHSAGLRSEKPKVSKVKAKRVELPAKVTETRSNVQNIENA